MALVETLPFQTEGKYISPHNETQNWIEYHFDFVPILTVLSQLTEWQLKARNMETAVLMYRYSQPAALDPPS